MGSHVHFESSMRVLGNLNSDPLFHDKLVLELFDFLCPSLIIDITLTESHDLKLRNDAKLLCKTKIFCERFMITIMMLTSKVPPKYLCFTVSSSVQLARVSLSNSH